MITSKLIILKHQVGKDKTLPILIRLSSNGDSEYINLKIRIKIEHWDEKKGRINNKNPNQIFINSHLIESLRKVEQYILKNPFKSKSYVKENYDGNRAACFLTFMEEVIHQNAEKWSYHYFKFMNTILTKVKAVRSELQFGEVDIHFLNEFTEYWYKKGNEQNTINGNLKKFGSFVREAVKQGYIEFKDNPFLHYKLVIKPSKDKFFTMEDIDRIRDFDCSGWCELSRDAYLFSFYCAGVRFTDIATMENANVAQNRLKYVMNKNGKVKDILLSPPALEIYNKYKSGGKYIFPIINKRFQHNEWVIKEAKRLLEHYKQNPNIKRLNVIIKPKTLATPKQLSSQNLFDFLIETNTSVTKLFEDNTNVFELFKKTAIGSETNSKNYLVNKSLKKIENSLGLTTHISFHTARHSFANYCVSKKVHLKTVQEMLGHSKIGTTQTYLRRFDQSESDHAIGTLFG